MKIQLSHDEKRYLFTLMVSLSRAHTQDKHAQAFWLHLAKRFTPNNAIAHLRGPETQLILELLDRAIADVEKARNKNLTLETSVRAHALTLAFQAIKERLIAKQGGEHGTTKRPDVCNEEHNQGKEQEGRGPDATLSNT